MNAPEAIVFPDIQSQFDTRNLIINDVGVKGVRFPIAIEGRDRSLQTIATLALTVELPAPAKGTHMSRFIELLETQTEALDQKRFKILILDMLKRLGAKKGAIEMHFPFFIKKTAPVSKMTSQLDYDVRWLGRASDHGNYTFSMQVTAPVTSLCPCSKEISAYGAHNQRSHIMIDAELSSDMAIEELIAIAESSASCEVYSLLKRTDEKYVTECAYDNPKFVEDLVRGIALELNKEPHVDAYVVQAENFESIHNHSAFARIAQTNLAVGSTQMGKQNDWRV